MSESSLQMPERSYGCTFGCGNPYDYIMVDVRNGETDFLCVPCLVKVAADMVAVLTDPNSPEVLKAVAEMAGAEAAPMKGSKPKARGHNAPVTADDDDFIDTFDKIVTVDELPPEFR